MQLCEFGAEGSDVRLVLRGVEVWMVFGAWQFVVTFFKGEFVTSNDSGIDRKVTA